MLSDVKKSVTFNLHELQTMEIQAWKGACKVCCKYMLWNQESLECDACKGRVHRLCGSGFTKNQYALLEGSVISVAVSRLPS